MKYTLIALIVLLTNSCAVKSSPAESVEVSAPKLKEIVLTLASDSLMGRLSGSGYDLKSAQYIASVAESYGFEPLWDNNPLVEFEFPAERTAQRYYGGVDSLINKTYNVVMIKRVANSDGTLLVGAHYDHLGVAKSDNDSRGITKGDIFYGANDNATGVATALEVARLYAQRSSTAKRDMIFASFGAEELGLLGAKALVSELDERDVEVDFMLNFEMTGTLRGDSVNILGVDNFDLATTMKFTPNVDSLIFVPIPALTYGSDHIPFNLEGIPVACFASMGAVYYHVPQDNIQSINWEGLTKITRYADQFVNTLMTTEQLPEFIKTEK